jgi:hypothetical protein
VCDGDAASVSWTTNLSYTTSTFVWSATDNPNVAGETISAQPSSTIADALDNLSTIPQFVTYTAIATSAQGCSGPVGSMQIQVVPPVIVNLPDLNQLCSGSPVNALLSANVPSTYSWFVSLDNPEVVGESLFPSTGNLISDVLVNTSDVNQLVVYSITPTSVLGACLGQAQALAVIVKPPIEFLNASDVQICSGTSVDLELVANTDVNFTWFAASTPWVGGESTGINSTSTIGDVLTNTTSEPQTVFYSVVGTSTTDGCSSPVATLVVSVLPLPPVAPLGNTVYCPGDEVPARDIAGPVAGAIYNWVQTGENVGSTVYSGTGSIPSFIAVNTGALPTLATITVTASLTSGGLVCTGEPDAGYVCVTRYRSVRRCVRSASSSFRSSSWNNLAMVIHLATIGLIASRS